jgi:hypothetical protein
LVASNCALSQPSPFPVARSSIFSLNANEDGFVISRRLLAPSIREEVTTAAVSGKLTRQLSHDFGRAGRHDSGPSMGSLRAPMLPAPFQFILAMIA